MGFVTLAQVSLSSNASFGGSHTDQQVGEQLRRFLVRSIPGVYDDDVHVTEASTRRRRNAAVSSIDLRITINTRVFGEEFVVASLKVALRDAAATALRAILGDDTVTVRIVQWPVAVLRCLTQEECPVLNCEADEIEYQSQYPSVRRCCPVCIRRVEYMSREIEAYHEATEHWRVAQEQQDADFLNIDQAQYEQDLADFMEQFDAYKADAAAWDQDWYGYLHNESLYYDLTCP